VAVSSRTLPILILGAVRPSSTADQPEAVAMLDHPHVSGCLNCCYRRASRRSPPSRRIARNRVVFTGASSVSVTR